MTQFSLSPTPLNTSISFGVAVGGMEGGKEIPINMHEGISTGREDATDSRNLDDPISGSKQTRNQIEPDIGQQTERFNNKSASRLSKNKRDNIKKKRNT